MQYICLTLWDIALNIGKMINKDIKWKNEIIKKNEISSLEKRFLIWKNYKAPILNKNGLAKERVE